MAKLFRILAALAIGLFVLAPPAAALAAVSPYTAVKTGDVVLAVAATPSGGELFVGSRDNHLYAVNPAGRVLWKYAAPNSVSEVAVSPGGRFVAAVDQSRNLYLFTAGGKLLWQQSLLMAPTGLAVTAGARRVYVTVGNIPLMYVYNRRGSQQGQVTLPVGGVGLSLAAHSPDLILAGNDGSVYDLTPAGRTVWSYALPGPVNAVSLSPDGRFVAAASQDQSVYLLNARGRLVWSHDFHDVVNWVSASARAQYVAVALNNANRLVLLNRAGHTVWQYDTGQPNNAVAIAADGRVLIGGSQTHAAYIVPVPAALAAYRSAQAQGLALRVAAAVAAALLLAAAGWLVCRSQSGRRLLKQIYRSRASYLMLLPTFALLLVFNYYPAVSGLYHSLYRWNPGSESFFIGFANFAQMASDQLLLVGIPHLLIMMAFGVVLGGVGAPLLIAELMFFVKSQRAQYWYRVLFIVPLVIPAVAGLLIWQNMYDPNVGLINETLRAIGLGNWAQDWLGNPRLALGSLIFMGFPWANIIAILVFYAGLQAIPGDLIDAGKVDGAKLGTIIRHIHVPMLTGQFKFILVTSVIGGLQAFGVQLVMTGGGPENATFVPGLEMYYAATKYDQLGYSAAISVTMFIIILILTIVQMRFIKSTAAD